ncbi:hypothetical protein GYH30_042663 [Glycine max]|nr:hypothetical protein GYH30_042663 [Glycine max]
MPSDGKGEEADVSEGAGEAACDNANEDVIEDGEGFEEGLWSGPGPFGGGGEGESGGVGRKVCEERKKIGEV